MFYYWNRGSAEQDEIDQTIFHRYVHIGKSQTDIQDTTHIITKFVEMAIKSLGSDDFKTAINSIHQISDILRKICDVSQFSSYLVDDSGVVRMVIPDKKFEDFLYDGFANIRHYADVILSLQWSCLKRLEISPRPLGQLITTTFGSLPSTRLKALKKNIYLFKIKNIFCIFFMI